MVFEKFDDGDERFQKLLEIGQGKEHIDGIATEKVENLDPLTVQQLDNKLSQRLGYLDQNNETIVKLTEKAKQYEDRLHDEYEVDEQRTEEAVDVELFLYSYQAMQRYAEAVSELAKNQRLLMQTVNQVREMVDVSQMVNDLNQLEDIMKDRQDRSEKRVKEYIDWEKKKTNEQLSRLDDAIRGFQETVDGLNQTFSRMQRQLQVEQPQSRGRSKSASESTGSNSGSSSESGGSGGGGDVDLSDEKRNVRRVYDYLTDNSDVGVETVAEDLDYSESTVREAIRRLSNKRSVTIDVGERVNNL